MNWYASFIAMVVGILYVPQEVHGEIGSLRLTPNASRLLQRDVLLLETTFYNATPLEVRLQAPDDKVTGYFIRIQVYEEGSWQILRSVGEVGGGYGEPGGTRVGPGGTFAEHLYLHKYGDTFTFDRPGTYHLRAVVRANGVEVTSDAIEIRVAERSREDLNAIDALGELADEFKVISLEPKPHKFLAVKRVGGNIGASIGLYETLREFSTKRRYQGEPITTAAFCSALQREYDEASFDKGLILLAMDFERKRNVDDMLFVVNAIRRDSNLRRSFVAYLREKGRQPDDPEAVPSVAAQ
jgi:hypothetical protein